MNQVASGKENVRKNAAAKGRELYVAFQHGTIRENGMVKDAHSRAKFCGIQIYKAAVLKAAAVKALVVKVYVFKSDAVGVEAYDFLVLVYEVVNVVLDFVLVREMLKAIAVAVGQFAVIVEDGERCFLAAFCHALVLLEHSSIIKQRRLTFK